MKSPPVYQYALKALVLLVFPGFLRSTSAQEPGDFVVPDSRGPFAVGRMTFVERDESRDGRALVVDALYPVDPEDAVGPPSVYLEGLPSPVALDGPPVAEREPFPLILFSHGHSGNRFQSFFLTEALASHGFLVVAPDHTGNTVNDVLGPPAPFRTRDRPLDVSFLITRMLAKNESPGDPFYRRIDPARIGVTGHSFGGFTAMAVAGGYEDISSDPRVRAILPFAPLSSGLDETLSRIGVPTLILGGTADTYTPLDPESTRPFELIPALPRYRVDLMEAGHMSFTNICDLLEALRESGQAPAALALLEGHAAQGCVPELIPVNDAHRITILYAVAFLTSFVALDPRYERVLTREFVQETGIPVSFMEAGGSRFLRGDCNGDALLDISDASFSLAFLFAGGREPLCQEACDSNGDGQLDISDAIFVLGYLFEGAAAPSPPFPRCERATPEDCAEDLCRR